MKALIIFTKPLKSFKEDEAERTKKKGDQEASAEERQSKSLDHGGGRRRGKEQLGGGGGVTGLCTPAGSPGGAACAPAGRLSPPPANHDVAKHQPAARGPDWRSLAPLLGKDIIGALMEITGKTRFDTFFLSRSN